MKRPFSASQSSSLAAQAVGEGRQVAKVTKMVVGHIAFAPLRSLEEVGEAHQIFHPLYWEMSEATGLEAWAVASYTSQPLPWLPKK